MIVSFKNFRYSKSTNRLCYMTNLLTFDWRFLFLIPFQIVVHYSTIVACVILPSRIQSLVSFEFRLNFLLVLILLIQRYSCRCSNSADRLRRGLRIVIIEYLHSLLSCDIVVTVAILQSNFSAECIILKIQLAKEILTKNSLVCIAFESTSLVILR